MNKAISLKQKKFIETELAKGTKCPLIAQHLGISVWTVRKWSSRIKKKVVGSSTRSSIAWLFEYLFTKNG